MINPNSQLASWMDGSSAVEVNGQNLKVKQSGDKGKTTDTYSQYVLNFMIF